ncbi:protein of unknown function [Pseudomonas sp. JV551A1]|uniref:Uncharacterized protein n=1 Tax=Pseudomonas inefficax TaxID=2078786 RepID=A0AAQ1P3D9_9PSED|nr:protein of unknown function [Pseudomonas sp. JV551A1]SPO59044.1 protein of unknown function [Pseudomonas inefficax]
MMGLLCSPSRHARSHRVHNPKIPQDPVGAGLPANTGKAGAIHRVAFFAGEPAPTGCAARLLNSTHRKLTEK